MNRAATAWALTACLLLGSTGASAGDVPPRPEPAGRWAQLQVTSEVTTFPLLGEVVSTTRALLLIDMTVVSESLKVREDVCAVRITTDSKRVVTLLPPAWATALSGVRREASLALRAGRWTLEMPRKTVVLGARLNKPTDALPADSNDARVVDADADGHPGMTVVVDGLVSGQVRIVQRAWTELRGVFDGPDAIEGRVTFGRDQRLLEATSILLRRKPPSRVNPDPRRSWFKMRRVPPQTDCKALAGTAAELFGG